MKRREEGFTLTELVIAMAIFMTVLAVFAATIANFASATSKSVQISDQGNDARQAYSLFDRSVRAASSINRPQRGTVTTNWYVEWLTTATTPSLCTQWVLRTDTDTLALRTWVPVASGTTTPTAWRTVATDVVNTTSTADIPFVLNPATVTSPVQRLGINLYFRRGTPASTIINSDFVALNSSISSTSNPDVDKNGISDKEVCTEIANRRP